MKDLEEIRDFFFRRYNHHQPLQPRKASLNNLQHLPCHLSRSEAFSLINFEIGKQRKGMTLEARRLFSSNINRILIVYLSNKTERFAKCVADQFGFRNTQFINTT